MRDNAVNDNDLTIPVIQLPDDRPPVSAEDLLDLDQRDARIIIRLAVFATKLDFLLRNAVNDNEQKRRMEKELIALRRWRLRVLSRWGIIYAVTSLTVTGFISGVMWEIVKRIWDKLLGP